MPVRGRLSTWALFHLLGRTLGSVQVHKGQLEVLRRAQQASPGTPMVFLPLHKSHLDYVLLSFACTNYGIAAPLVAAGDNLRIPVIGWVRRRRQLAAATAGKSPTARVVVHFPG